MAVSLAALFGLCPLTSNFILPSNKINESPSAAVATLITTVSSPSDRPITVTPYTPTVMSPTLDSSTNTQIIPSSTTLPGCPARLETSKSESISDWKYIVKRADDLPTISMEILGNRNSWPLIVAYNIDQFGQNAQNSISPPPVFQGQVLKIPGVSIPMHVFLYPGETLSSLARRKYGEDYGSSLLWCTIAGDNLQISSPHIVQEGMDILLYPLVWPHNGIFARPEDTASKILFAYFPRTGDVDSACQWMQENQLDCEPIIPFDVFLFDRAPEPTYFVVGPDFDWPTIVLICYGEVTQRLLDRAYLANREIIGDDPDLARAGQTVKLFECLKFSADLTPQSQPPPPINISTPLPINASTTNPSSTVLPSLTASATIFVTAPNANEPQKDPFSSIISLEPCLTPLLSGLGLFLCYFVVHRYRQRQRQAELRATLIGRSLPRRKDNILIKFIEFISKFRDEE